MFQFSQILKKHVALDLNIFWIKNTFKYTFKPNKSDYLLTRETWKTSKKVKV